MKSRKINGEADDANHAMWQLLSDENWDGIRERLAKGEWNPNRPLVFALQPGGLFLLSAAVQHGQTAVAKQLIEFGADVNARMPGELQPLMEACDTGNQEMVNLLLQAGANANAKCSVSDEGDPGETPLMAAAMGGHREIVEMLLKSGARIDATTRRGRSVLSMLLDSRGVDLEQVRFLLDVGCPVDGRDLHYPILQRNLELVELLLGRRPDVNKPFDWPTHVDSPAKGDTPIFVAMSQTAQEMLARVTSEVRTKRAELLAIIDRLIEAGADINAPRGGKASGTTPLMMAVAQHDEEIMSRLIVAGAKVNATNREQDRNNA